MNTTNKPNWRDAPEWARYLAQDEDGVWFWYSIKPFEKTSCWYPINGKHRMASHKYENWKKTLEERPNGN